MVYMRKKEAATRNLSCPLQRRTSPSGRWLERQQAALMVVCQDGAPEERWLLNAQLRAAMEESQAAAVVSAGFRGRLRVRGTETDRWIGPVSGGFSRARVRWCHLVRLIDPGYFPFGLRIVV
jgi:hypothetical protein